ncbi:hypothetical protein C8R44DRAFT_728149 [Mycena epipterygia]|nr:hypothetical protein C8R44DRAFT_728149 [Mycena epipterygia]
MAVGVKNERRRPGGKTRREATSISVGHKRMPSGKETMVVGIKPKMSVGGSQCKGSEKIWPSGDKNMAIRGCLRVRNYPSSAEITATGLNVAVLRIYNLPLPVDGNPLAPKKPSPPPPDKRAAVFRGNRNPNSNLPTSACLPLSTFLRYRGIIVRGSATGSFALRR